MPGEAAGLSSGDVIVRLDDTDVTNRQALTDYVDPPRMAWLVLLLTGTHVAASTVRLYTKHAAVEFARWAGVTRGWGPPTRRSAATTWGGVAR